MESSFSEILPKEKLLLYFHSFYYEMGISIGLTFEKNKEIVHFFDNTLMPKFCEERCNVECKIKREETHKSIMGLSYRIKEKQFKNYRNRNCSYNLISYSFPVWDFNRKKVVAVIHAGSIRENNVNIEGNNLEQKDKDLYNIISQKELIDIENSFKKVYDFSIDLSHFYNLETGVNRYKTDFEKWYQNDWDKLKKDLLRLDIDIVKQKYSGKENTLGEFYCFLLDKIGESVDAEFGSYWSIHGQKNDKLIFRTTMNKGKEKFRKILEGNNFVLNVNNSFIGKCFKKGEVIYSADITDASQNYQWRQIEEDIIGKERIVIPLMKNKIKPIGLLCLTPGKNFQYSEYVKNIFENEIRYFLSRVVERILYQNEIERKELFRNELPKVVSVSREQFRIKYYEIVRSIYKDLDIEIFFKNDKINKLESLNGVTIDKLNNIPASIKTDIKRNYSKFLKLKDKEIHTSLTYKKTRNTDTGSKETFYAYIFATVRNYHKTGNPITGIIFGFQKIIHMKDILTEKDKEYIAYIAFVFSLNDSLFEPLEQAIWISKQLGHEVIKPLSPFIESYWGLQYYYEKGDKELIKKRNADLEHLFKFVMYYTQNLNKIDSFDLNKKYLTRENFYYRIIKQLQLFFEPYSIKEREIHINVVHNSNFPAEYKMYHDIMFRGFFNLIMNAIKYSYRPDDEKRLANKGKEDIVIEGLKNNNSNKWEISIKNFGIGILAKEQDKIFEKLFQGSNTYKHDNTGMGYGLNIAKRAIEIHKGEIEIRKTGEEENEFTEIVVHLPIIN